MTSLDRLVTTLGDLRATLRDGEFAGLPLLESRIAQDLALLEAERPGAEALEALRAHAIEAEALISAASRGLAAAKRQIAQIDALRAGTGTYDSAGRKFTVGGADRSTSHRA